MIYYLCGEDIQAKDDKIQEIKNQHLSTLEAQKFDFQSIHAARLTPATLKKSLIEIPAVALSRVVVLRGIEKLTDQNKALITDFIDQKQKQPVLILDTDKVPGKNKFFDYLNKTTKAFRFTNNVSGNIFDVTNAMERRNTVEALKRLNALLEQGEHPLQLMGGLVWFWGRAKSRVSRDVFKKGLLFLQEADLNIKRTRMKSEAALEVLIVKLCSLLAC
ncbi:hypothetical protein ACFL49_01050 [Candidatus Omnitrophota bacterium]